MQSNWKRSGIIYILFLLVGVALATVLFSSPQKPAEVSVTQVITMSNEGKIQTLAEQGQWLNITTTDGEKLKANIGVLNYNDLRQLGLNPSTPYDIKAGGIDWGTVLLTFLPMLLFGAFIFFMFFRARGANNQVLGFSRSKARLSSPDKPSITFEDVAGVDEAKQELREVVDFLKAREKFQTLGARIPRGVLLVGPPGTGKTLLARAVAGEAGVPFFSISGSEFVEMFVGVGAARVRDLFEQAKRHAPSIVFVDEIDAVGRQRGAGLGGSHDEREQTLNQILTEMDGFDTNTSVIVIAATNRPDILDPALLRPGRFDRRVVLDRPDVIGRVAILKVHTKGKPLDKAVDLEVLAKQTAGFSGADLANLVNEAAILAGRRGKKSIEMVDLEESIDKVLLGPERKSRRMTAKEKELTAYHEGGHALVAKLMPDTTDPPRKISIIPRGMAGGYTKMLGEDRLYSSRARFLADITVFLGGRAAEELIFNERSSGAFSDIKQATAIARRMVTDLGMSDKLGPRTFGDKQELVFLGREISEQKDYGDKIANIIDEEINKIIEDSHNAAMKLLTEHKDKLIQIAETLITKETIEAEELDALFASAVPSDQPKTPPVAPPPMADGTAAKMKPPKKAPTVLPPLPETGSA
ncbi:MAG: ATP-dependent zinc metalloprotease FtsH [Dehalococcoidales bacterium]|nr:ATP-dependent zinc metalloprotease FtsH [Dehalococcoidales bacterium]